MKQLAGSCLGPLVLGVVIWRLTGIFTAGNAVFVLTCLATGRWRFRVPPTSHLSIIERPH